MRTKIFVDNCPGSTTAETLGALFKGAGHVESITVPGGSGPGPTHAFVVMATLGEAVTAIQMFNGLEWNGSHLTVTKATSARPGGFGGGSSRAERKNR